MSAPLANDSRARPKVLGSSTTDMLSSERPAHRGALHRTRRLQADGDDVANDNGSGAAALERHRVGGHLVEGAAPDLLFRPRGVDDHGRGRAAPPAAIDQAARNRRRARDAHQHDDGDAVRLQLCDRRPEHVLVVARDDKECCADAGAAIALLTPGTTSYETPARCNASASSLPRPNTNGSPPFSRTMRRPRR